MMDSARLLSAIGATVLAAAIAAGCAGGPGGPAALSVTISSPSSTVYTASSLSIQVAVTGSPDTVELRHNDDLLVVLLPPYQYVWATEGEPEGAHQLTAVARRGSAQVVSEPRTVVVDRTRPTVLARTPAPNDDNVWVGDPIVITFSEPMRVTSLNPGTVSLEVVGGSPVTVSFTPSTDGTSLTLVPDGPMAVPTQLRLTLDDAISDLAGNALVTPAPWTWTLPRWQWMGGAPLLVQGDLGVPQARAALGSDGHPSVAWLEERGGTVPPSDVQAARWDGLGWEVLGERLNGDDRVGPMYGHQDVAVASDGAVIVAWNSPVFGVPDRLWVHRWDGVSWQAIGGGPVNDPDTVSAVGLVSLTLDALDRPVVAWGARPGGVAADGDIRITRWTGSTWVAVGTPRRRNPAHVSFNPVLALDTEGHPIVAWTERQGDTSTNDVFVDRWTGSAWVALGGSLRPGSWTAANVSGLALAASGEPIAAMQVTSGDDRRVAVRRWSETGGTWTSLGTTLRLTPDSNTWVPRVTVDAAGRPLVLWSEWGPGAAGRYLVWRFETSIWRDLAFPDAAAPVYGSGDLAVGDAGELFVAAPWREVAGDRYHLRVFRYNGVP